MPRIARFWDALPRFGHPPSCREPGMCPENTGLRQAFSETVQRCGEALRHGFEPRLESLALDNRFDDRHVAMAYTGKTAILGTRMPEESQLLPSQWLRHFVTGSRVKIRITPSQDRAPVPVPTPTSRLWAGSAHGRGRIP